MMNEEVLQGFEWLWTEALEQHFLVRLDAHTGEKLLIYRITSETSGVVIIEDDNLHTAVVNKMRESGVPIIDAAQAQKLRERVHSQ
jgi:hypothetical protein